MRHGLSAVFLGLFVASQCLAADSIFPATPTKPDKAYPKFHIGVTGINAKIEKGLLVTVEDTTADTPAHGKFRKGDILLKVNGKPVSDPEPYIALGNALTAAEADDGKLAFTVKRGDKEQTVEITIPVLGAYSKTWPLNCKKSDAIVRQCAEFATRPENLKKPGFFGGLFLLSTGDDQYLPAVKTMVDRNPADKVGSGSHWVNGYQGVLIGEYYLRTGDKSALPRMKALCDYAAENQNYGGWTHGGGPGPGYVQGGLMNPAGVQILTTLILAKECGVDVDQGTFDRALKFFYRFAGHTAVPYGDHRPELWLTCNGKNGMLAAAMTCLDGKAYQMAAQTMSLDQADSYRWLGLGHASSFGDHAWRGLGSVNIPPDKQSNYRRSLEKLTWYYDLARLPGGGFKLLNLGANPNAGGPLALAMTYTAPRKTLRITGAPHTQYSHEVKAPELPWGRPSDLEFLRTDYCEGFGKEEMEPHEIYDRLGAAKKLKELDDAEKAFLVKMVRHYNPVARTMAAQALGKFCVTNEILAAIQDTDPRVRRVGLEGISQYRAWWGGGKSFFKPEAVSQVFLPTILKILNDKNSSYWEIDGALLALGMAKPEDVQDNLGIVRKYLRHDEWWLREASWRALEPLSKNGKMIEPLLPELFDALAVETHVMPRRVFGSFMRNMLKDGKLDPAIKQEIGDGMMKAMHDTVIAPGILSAIGRSNKYETMRYFLEQTPEAASQVLDMVEQLLEQEAIPPSGIWIRGTIGGDPWGNAGVINSAVKLGKERAEPILARCRAFVASLDEQKKKPGANVKAIEKDQAHMLKCLDGAENKLASGTVQKPKKK